MNLLNKNIGFTPLEIKSYLLRRKLSNRTYQDTIRDFKSNRTRFLTGFMLLEVMVALAILSIGIMTVMQSFSSALRASKYSYNSTIATLLAQSKLSDLEREGSWTKENLSGDFGKGYPNFKWEMEVSLVELDKLIPESLRTRNMEEEEESEDEENKPKVNLVNLTVSWVERGVTEEAVFATYVINSNDPLFVGTPNQNAK